MSEQGIQLTTAQWQMMQHFKIFGSAPRSFINMNTAKSLIKKGLCKFDSSSDNIILTKSGKNYNKKPQS